MEKIIIEDLVRVKIIEIEEVLFYNGYFSYKETARSYVNALVDFIFNIPNQSKYPTLRKDYGEWYCSYKPNKHTHWYITFDTDERLYIIRNVINNHTKEYPAFIRDLG